MTGSEFLSWAIDLLEQIENSPEKKAWCHQYSVYSSNPGQEELSRDLDDFMTGAYENGLVITNYHDVLQRWSLDEQSVVSADPAWLKTQPYLCVLASIAWHFRRDHFCEGSLISESVADGAMFRLLRRLQQLCPVATPVTTLQTLYRCGCDCIPEVSGVYWILCPEGMTIRFTEHTYNHSAKLYPMEKLSRKYKDCKDQKVLYIGKAAGKKGLRQRLKQYMNYGWDHASNHKGGRAIWQIEDAGFLLLAFEECENAAAREKQLLADYKAKSGSYPLANWRG